VDGAPKKSMGVSSKAAGVQNVLSVPFSRREQFMRIDADIAAAHTGQIVLHSVNVVIPFLSAVQYFSQ
jgi:hypothetical protein